MKKPSVGKTIWGCIYPLIIFIGVDTVISMVAMFIISFWEAFNMGQVADYYEAYMQIFNNSMNVFYKYALYFTIARCVIVVPIFFILMRKDVKREIMDGTHVYYEKFNKAWLLLVIPIGMFACIGFNNLVMMFAELAQSFINYIIDTLNLDVEYDIFGSFNETSDIIYSGGLVFQLLATCVGAPFAEELLFRGLIHRRLRKILNMIPAMLISSLLFGIIHGNIIQGVYAFLIGLMCAFVYEKFKNLWAPIILHASANSLAVISTYLATESEGVGLNLATYILYTVVMISCAVGLLLLLEKKLIRKEIPQPQIIVEETNSNQGEI